MASTNETYFRRYLVDPTSVSSGQTPPQDGNIIQGPQGPPGPIGPTGPAGPINSVENNGTPLTVRPTLNFTGTGIVASDNSVSNRTDVTITAGVSSVFTRTGTIVAQAGDYSASQITNAVDKTQIYADPTWITSLNWSKIISTPTFVNSFNTRTGAVVPTSGDYTAAQVTNAVSTIGSYSDPAWFTALSWSKILSPPNFLLNPLTTKGDLISYSTASGRLAVGSNNQMLIADSTQTFGIKWGVPTAAMVTNAVDQTGSYTNPAWIVSIPWSKLTSVPSLVNTFNTRSGTVVPVTGDYTAAQVTNAVDSTQTYANPAWITSLAWAKITGTPSVGSYQTPWLQAINGGGFSLSSVNNVSATTFTASSKGNQFGTSAGAATTPATTDANILLYNTSSTNWAGIGTDSSGDIWFKTGTSGTPNACVLISASGQVGIGTTSPSNILDVSGTLRSIASTTPTSGAGLELVYSTQGYIQAYDRTGAAYKVLAIEGSTTTINASSGGKVGIGMTPTHQLQLSTDDAAKLTTNTWTIASGAAVKQHVKPLKGGLEIINKLAPKEAEYNGKHGTPKGQRVVSFIAEEVQKVLPHTVTKDSEGQLGFNVHEVIFQLVLAVQQLSDEVSKLKKN